MELLKRAPREVSEKGDVPDAHRWRITSDELKGGFRLRASRTRATTFNITYVIIQGMNETYRAPAREARE
jgi:hypothetical protein